MQFPSQNGRGEEISCASAGATTRIATLSRRLRGSRSEWKKPLDLKQLGIQDRSARRAANRIVTQEDELRAEQRALSHAADGGCHAAFRVAVEVWLGAIGLRADDDR